MSRPTDTQQASRGLAGKIVAAVLFAALIFAALAIYSDVTALLATARSFSLGAFGIGLALALGNYGLRIARWQYYLKRIDVHIPLAESSVVFLAGFVMSVTPGKVGEVFKSLMLYESRGIPITRTAPVVVAERLTDLVALVLLTAIGALAFENGVAVAAGGAVLVGFMVLVCSYRPLGKLLLGIADRLPLISRIGPKLHEAYDSLLAMTRIGPMAVGTGIAFIAWGMECGSLYAIVHGFDGVSLPWDAATFAYSASTIGGALAMMPGGLGVTEIGMTWLLQTLGGEALTPAIATATTILVRLATLWFAVIIGAIALAAYKTRRHGT